MSKTGDTPLIQILFNNLNFKVMKQRENFGKGEKCLYVRRGDNNEIVVTKVQHGELIEEKDTVHLDYDEARILGIQLLKLATDVLPQDGVELKPESTSYADSITVCQIDNPDGTPSNTAHIAISESEELEEIRTGNCDEPGFSISGEALENLISVLAKIV